MSREHLFEREQWVARPLTETFELFADAFALERITPPWLGFRVLSPEPIELSVGTLIDYRLRLHGVPIRWRTRIEAWEPPRRFVDTQLQGPYRSWRHTHSFTESGRGTTIADSVRYKLPLGPVGELAHRLLVRRDVERIFDYRRRAVARLLERPRSR